MPRTIAAKKKRKSLYSVHPGVAMVQDWIDKLPEKTGRSLEEWIELVQKSGPPTEKERREWLKTEHKMERTAPGGLPSEPKAKVWRTAILKLISKRPKNMSKLSMPAGNLTFGPFSTGYWS